MFKNTFDAHQQLRFTRPDACRWIRQDVGRFLPVEKKYSPDQPRDERGRWTDGSSDQRSNTNPNASIGNLSIDEILAKAKSLQLIGSPADYRACVKLCYPLLERFSSPGSDRNYWDFQKCLNACLRRSI